MCTNLPWKHFKQFLSPTKVFFLPYSQDSSEFLFSDNMLLLEGTAVAMIVTHFSITHFFLTAYVGMAENFQEGNLKESRSREHFQYLGECNDTGYSVTYWCSHQNIFSKQWMECENAVNFYQFLWEMESDSELFPIQTCIFIIWLLNIFFFYHHFCCFNFIAEYIFFHYLLSILLSVHVFGVFGISLSP